jgi:arylsulfatase A-like enzyme
MTRRLMGPGLLLVLTACRPQAEPPPPLNVVFLLVDDLGWRDVGAFGSRFYETPNIDRLSADGMRFTNAYAAAPVCSPTRGSILSGKYPARTNTTDWFGADRAGSLLPAPYVPQLPLEEVTLAEAFKEAGYATAFVGKWHLGDRPYFPENQGFDRNVAGDKWGAPPTYFYPYENPDSPGWGRRLGLPGGEEGELLTDRLTDESLKFLDESREGPFLLYLSYYAVHTPLMTKPELEAKYEAKRAALPPADGPRFVPEGPRENRQVQDHPVYAGMVQSVDESVGRVLARLEELGVADRTAVVFMSDNGGLSTSEGSPTSNVPLRAGKGWLYEGGIREPMIIKWPGVVAPGSACDEPVISTDFYPTLLEMAGLPPKPEQHVDGLSLVPLLEQTGTLDRQELFWHYPHYGNQGTTPSGAIRDGDLKLIEYFEDGRVELFDLSEDIGEQHDLAAESPEEVKRLRERLESWRAEVDAAMPRGPNPDFDPVAWQEWHRRQRERDGSTVTKR